MAAYNISAAATALKTGLEALADTFYEVEIGMPNSPVGQGPSARITFGGMSVAETTLTHPVEVHNIIVKVYQASYSVGEQERALDASQLAADVLAVVYADFTLGGNCRNVDIGGQYTGGIDVELVDEDVADASYHVANITIPLIVDNTTAFAA